MPDSIRRVGVTGASGYVGTYLTSTLAPEWQVVSLGRRPGPGCAEHRWADMSEAMPVGLVDGLDAVVHLAANTAGGTVSMDQEVAFALALAAKAHERRIPFLFVSSQAASRKAPSSYGRTKAAIEEAIRPLGATVIRPGLVYGSDERGLFGLLVALLRRFPIRPQLLPSPSVQPIHVADLAQAMSAAISDDAHRALTFNVAGQPIAFNDFLEMIARYRLRRPAIPLPVPAALVRLALVAGKPLLGPRFDPERLDSLTRLDSMATCSDMASLEVVARDPRDGLSRSGRPWRRILLEGRALARGLMAVGAVPPGLLRRYAHALACHGSAKALGLSPTLLSYPALLASLDSHSCRANADIDSVVGRLNMMSRLCESEPRLAGLFMRRKATRSLMAAMGDFVLATAREAQSRLLRPVARLLAGPAS